MNEQETDMVSAVIPTAVRAATSAAVPAVMPAVLPAVGTAPPGTGQLATIIAWVTFLAGVCLIGAFVASMGKAGLSALRHGQFEGGAGAALTLVAGVFLTAAGAIFGALGIQA